MKINKVESDFGLLTQNITLIPFSIIINVPTVTFVEILKLKGKQEEQA